MKLEPCIGCGRMTLTHSIANLTVKCDPSPLDGQGVAEELGAGRQIWTPEFGPGLIPKKLRGARPGDAKILREHRCTAAGALRSPSPVPGASQPPKGRETGVQDVLATPSPERLSLAAPSTPSSAPRTAPSSARRAANPRSDLTHRGSSPAGADCSTCGRPIDVGDVNAYALIQLGAIVIDAFHTSGCP